MDTQHYHIVPSDDIARSKRLRLHKRSLRLVRMQIFPNLSNACTPAEWDKQPNAIERHFDSIVTNVRRPPLDAR